MIFKITLILALIILFVVWYCLPDDDGTSGE